MSPSHATLLEEIQRLRARVATLELDRQIPKEIIEKAPVMISIVRAPDFVYELVNPAFQALGPGKEFLGRRFTDVWPEVSDELVEILQKVIATGQAFHREEAPYRIQRGPGLPLEEIYVSYSWIPLFNTEGKADRVLTLAHEVTEAVRQRKQLRQSVERLEGVLAVETVGVMFWDLNTGCLYDANETFLKLMGYSRAEVEGCELTWQKLTPPEYMDVSRAEVEELLATGHGHAYEKEYFCKDGTRRWLLFAASLLDSNRCVEICVDISDRKAAEKALRESEERFRGLVSASSEVLYLMSPDWSEMRQLSGGHFLKTTTAPNRNWLEDYIPPDDQPLVTAAIQEAIRTRSLFELEHRVRRADGAVGWTSSRAIPRLDAEGRILEWFGAASDITERKKVQDQLRESEALFRTLANSIPQLCWVANSDGWIHWYNQRWYDYTGTTPEQMEGWGWQSVHDPEVLPAVLERWRASIALEQPFEMVFPLRGADGVFRPFLTRVEPFRDHDGKLTRWFGTNTDISEQRRTEETLRTQAELLRLSFDAIVSWKLDGAIESWNVGAERLYGIPEAEALGRVSRELLATEFPRPWEEFRADLVASGVWEGELVQHARDGSRLIVWARFQLIRGADGVHRVLETNRDITERKQTEERLRQTQKMESIGLLAGGIAHDFNNLLTGILGNASMILDEVDPRIGRHVQSIVDSAERAANLTRQLLAYSGQGQFVVKEVDVSRAIDGMRDLLESFVPTNARLTLNLETRLPAVRMDPGQAQQIVMNLVINARGHRQPPLGHHRRFYKACGRPRFVCRCSRTGGRARQIRRDYCDRHRSGHRARGQGENLRPVLYDEVHRPRARAGRGRRDREITERRHHRREPAGPGQHFPRAYPRGSAAIRAARREPGTERAYDSGCR